MELKPKLVLTTTKTKQAKKLFVCVSINLRFSTVLHLISLCHSRNTFFLRCRAYNNHMQKILKHHKLRHANTAHGTSMKLRLRVQLLWDLCVSFVQKKLTACPSQMPVPNKHKVNSVIDSIKSLGFLFEAFFLSWSHFSCAFSEAKKTHLQEHWPFS